MRYCKNYKYLTLARRTWMFRYERTWMFGMNRSLFYGLNLNNLLLFLSDALMATVAFSIALIQVTDAHWMNANAFAQCAVLCSILHLCLLAVGLYNEKLRESFTGFGLRILSSVVITYMLFSMIDLLLPNIFYGSLISTFSIYATGLLLVSRFFIYKYKFNELFKRNVLVLGAGKRAKAIKYYMRRQSDYIGLNMNGFWPLAEEVYQKDNDEIIFSSASLTDFVKRHNINEIVIAHDEHKTKPPFDELLALKRQGVQLTNVLQFVERETGQVVVDELSPANFIYQHSLQNRMITLGYWLFNCFIAILFGVITLPIMLITAIAIKIEKGWNFPVFYSQQRVGLHGKLFFIYKFTSMTKEAESNGPQWAQVNDPRITKVGKVIRKFRIDELPQLYNVIAGDMFFVGPRPERPEFTANFSQNLPFYQQRHNVKPGLTGWAQLKYPYGSSAEDAFEKLKFDLYYVKKRSFLFDLLILLKTSEIVLFGKGR